MSPEAAETAESTHTAPASGRRPRYDVVVVGGGAGGLSGALTLARARRAVLVIDEGRPRNAPAAHVHGYLSREGVAPDRLLALGREEVTGYGGHFHQGRVVSAARVAAGDPSRADASPGDEAPNGPVGTGDFEVTLADGSTVRARRLLVATGLVDEVPDVPDVAGRWGRDVLHCPYCHGWEVRDQPIGVLATGPFAVHQALLWRQWSDDITLFLHTTPEPTEEEYEQLAARGVSVVDGKVSGLDVEDDRLAAVLLADGTRIARRALVIGARMTANADVTAALGLGVTEQLTAGHVAGTYVPADPTGATEVPGVWVAGNVTGITDQVVGAAAAGVRAAAAINADLMAEETREAVKARR